MEERKEDVYLLDWVILQIRSSDCGVRDRIIRLKAKVDIR